jgi:hypothetical protein
MVTSPHEASHRIFQEQPDLLAPVFRILDVPLPEKATVEVLTPELEALAHALDSADRDSARYYTELLEIGLGDTPAATTWKELMMVGTYFPGRGTMIEKAFLEGEAEGKAEGKAQSIVHMLRRRNITVSPDTEQTIMECKDLDTLDLWFDRALDATRTEDLFTLRT